MGGVVKFTIHANNVEWQREYLPRFTAGLTEHGHRVHHTQNDEADPDGINILFANNSWRLTHQQCINKKIPMITVGRCFFGSRFDMVAIGWDGFNGAADFCLEDDMPDDRWAKHGVALPEETIHNQEGYVLVCGEYRLMDQWYAQLAEELAGEDVRFRSHPFKKGAKHSFREAPFAGQDDIASLFPDVSVVVTYDSIAGCDAVLAGVPTIACADTSAARDVAFHSWRAYKDRAAPTLDIDVWANRLAYCQWSHDEISNGEFWEHLKHGAEKRA